MKISWKDGLICFLTVMVFVLAGFLIREGGGEKDLARDNPLPPRPSRDSGRDPDKDPYQKFQVKNTIAKHSPQIQKCYLELLEKEKETGALKTEGQVTLDWQIDAEGRAKRVEVVGTDFRMETFETCLRRTIEEWEFPPPPKDQIPYYTFFKFNFKKETN